MFVGDILLDNKLYFVLYFGKNQNGEHQFVVYFGSEVIEENTALFSNIMNEYYKKGYLESVLVLIEITKD